MLYTHHHEGTKEKLSGKMKPVFGHRMGRGSSSVVGRDRVQSLSLGCDRAHPPGVGRGGVYPSTLGRGGAIPKASGEAETSLQPSGEAELSRRRRAERRPALCPRARRGWPKGISRDGSQPFALGQGGAGLKVSSEMEPNFHHSGKERSGTLVRPEVFNIRWLLVPPSGVPWY